VWCGEVFGVDYVGGGDFVCRRHFDGSVLLLFG
jgi:hypothetical protein